MNLPPAFVLRMKEELGSDSTNFFDAIQSPAPTSIHLHHQKGNILNPAWCFGLVPWYEKGFYLKERPIFTADPLFHAGAYYVQEASSMAVYHALESLGISNKNGLRILDLCSSPGGKSTLVLSWLHGNGILVSNETISSRIAPLLHNLSKWGYSNKILTSSDPSKLGLLTDYFDIILVDAPCSGEGLFRKDPESIKHWNDQNLEQCAMRQHRILQDIIPALKPDGYLIYSTCTYNPKENINQLVTLKDFISIQLPSLPEYGFRIIEKESKLGYQAYPHKVKGEGFFISLLQKKGTAQNNSYRANALHWDKNFEWNNWLSTEIPIFNHQDALFAFAHNKDLEIIAAYARIIQAGTKLGHFNGNQFNPDYDLALSNLVHSQIDRIEVDKYQAISYLKKNTIANDEQKKGYVLVTFKNLPIGWAKAIPGRCNNLLPKEYRILSQYI